MQNLNYWKQFESTGRIEDYLSYCSCLMREPSGEESASAHEEAYEGGREQSGVNPYAGYSMCNRNGFETDAYR